MSLVEVVIKKELPMKVLVVGASGATGGHVVDQLLSQGVEVNAIVRSIDALPDKPSLNKIQASVHGLTKLEMAEYLKGCDAAVSCLGHNLTFKGMFGKPRLLVTDTVECICQAIKSNKSGSPVKVVLMNTTGNSNRDIPEIPPIKSAYRYRDIKSLVASACRL